jgi:hypothetical protein
MVSALRTGRAMLGGLGQTLSHTQTSHRDPWAWRCPAGNFPDHALCVHSATCSKHRTGLKTHSWQRRWQLIHELPGVHMDRTCAEVFCPGRVSGGEGKKHLPAQVVWVWISHLPLSCSPWAPPIFWVSGLWVCSSVELPHLQSCDSMK